MYRAIICYRRFFSFFVSVFFFTRRPRPGRVAKNCQEMKRCGAIIDSFLVFEDTDLYCITYCTTFSLATAVGTARQAAVKIWYISSSLFFLIFHFSFVRGPWREAFNLFSPLNSFIMEGESDWAFFTLNSKRLLEILCNSMCSEVCEAVHSDDSNTLSNQDEKNDTKDCKRFK